MNDDERQIRELVATWMAATKAHDSRTVLGLMTDDVLFLVPGHPPFGKEKFAATASGTATSGVQFDGTSEILEVTVTGDWAYTVSRLKVVTRGPGSAEATRSGHTLTVLTKKSGRWQVHRDANLLGPAKQ